MFERYVAPAIIILCAIALFVLARVFSRAGRSGRAMLDVVGGCSLLIVAYYLITQNP